MQDKTAKENSSSTSSHIQDLTHLLDYLASELFRYGVFAVLLLSLPSDSDFWAWPNWLDAGL